jgi:uncharacterized protein YbaR (Trm112 family)
MDIVHNHKEPSEGSLAIKVACPACKRPLYAHNEDSGSTVWCPWPHCDTMGAGPNEGGHGRSEAKALEVLMAKLGIGKWTNEADPEPVSSSTDTPTTSDAPKKRGRKAKGGSVAFTVPAGEFTIKEFCELNKTYPYKALPFFKANKIREAGKRPTKSGRGKPATLYTA